MKAAPATEITRVDQIRALSSPLRQEIVDTLRAAGPSSAAELGELLGRPADALYYHLRMLRDVELVSESPRELDNGRTEAEYRLVSQRLALRYDKDDEESTEAIVRTMSAALRSDRERRARTSAATPRAPASPAGCAPRSSPSSTATCARSRT